MEVDADPAHDEAREGTLSPYSRLRALPSSDQDSGEDGPHDFPSSRHAAIMASEDDATERLLHGEITAVRTFLQDASAEQRQHMRHLSGHASSAAGLSDRPLRQEDSDSDSDLRVEQQSNARRHEQGMSRHPLRTRKGPTKGLSGAAVPKPTSDRAVPGDSGGVSVTLPKAEHAKGRRLVVPADPSLPIAAVYMRGDCQFIHQGSRAHIARFSLPAEKARRGVASRHVVDAVAVDARTIVIGYDAGPTQVSCLLLGSERPRHVDVPHRGHTTVVEHASGTSSQNPGISALAALPADGGGRRRFLSGGGDGSVRLWTLAGADGALRGASTPLALAPGQPVRCLAYRASDGAVFAGHARHVSCAHVEAARAGKPALLSAAPLQVHVHPQDPRVVLLEVDHLDRQVQIFDLRRNLDMGPVMEFGHRAAPSMSPARHMYRRGSTSHTLFARGYGDGTLCVWDYRNKSNVLLQSRAREDPIVHAVLNGDQVIAYGAYRVTFWSLTDF
ncbi:hypothetical protein PsYK624_007430 [Phanerochaete sordida]|uniref:WD40 repeat-like protein n=1 Tax=Phanerochaete sordida TaxID=48140 RepID=A0A9P3FX14_9APHY|nr:hypothetical protein PsYK624_007430 [Phanerochaete sordida]